jgi:hypothetical protein
MARACIVQEPQETNQTKGNPGTPGRRAVSLNPMLLNPIPRHNDNKFPRKLRYILPANSLHAYFVMLGGVGRAASQRSDRHSLAYGCDKVKIWLWERV